MRLCGIALLLSIYKTLYHSVSNEGRTVECMQTAQFVFFKLMCLVLLNTLKSLKSLYHYQVKKNPHTLKLIVSKSFSFCGASGYANFCFQNSLGLSIQGVNDLLVTYLSGSFKVSQQMRSKWFTDSEYV